MDPSVFYQARPPSPPVSLPCVPGPKLAPFTRNAHADIEFIEFLGRENDVDSLVWKVKIDKAGPFALKVVSVKAQYTGSTPVRSNRTLTLTRSLLPSFTSGTGTFSAGTRTVTSRGRSPARSSMLITLTRSTVSVVPMADSRRKRARTWPSGPSAISFSHRSKKLTWL